jgi:hypothetical protein
VAVEAGEIEVADGSLQIVLGQVNLENDKCPRQKFADSPLRVADGIHTGH